MKKFLLLLPVFLIIIFFHSADNALAYLIPGTSVDCPHANPSGAIPCAVGKHYVGNSCLDDSAIKTVIDSCVSTASTIKTYSCVSNSCVISCANTYISCNGVCQQPINPNPVCPTCAAPNTCNGTCSAVPPQRLIKDPVTSTFKTEYTDEQVSVGGPWKSNVSNANDISYTAGNVGIGTLSPQGPLQVEVPNALLAGFGLSNIGVAGAGMGGGGAFWDGNSSAVVFLANDDIGVTASGNTYGGDFRDADNSGRAFLGQGDTGILAAGNSVGGFFADSNSSGYALVGGGDVGIVGYGNSYGAFFKDNDNSGNAYIGYGDYGIEASGATAGGFFKDFNNSGVAYLGVDNTGILASGTDYGILATGNGAGAYFTDGNAADSAAYLGINGYSMLAEGPINVDESGTPALYVSGAEALWYNGSIFSWGFGGTKNYFADPVGIGTSTPAAPLQVVGANNLLAAFGPTIGVVASADGGGGLFLDANSTGAAALANDDIGMAASGSSLGVWGTSSFVAGYFNNTTGASSAMMATNGGVGVVGYGDTAGAYFSDSNNSGVDVYLAQGSYSVDTNGRINIGKTGRALDVNGAEAIWYDGTYFSWGYGGSSNYFADEVGIGVKTPTVKLDVEGSAFTYIAQFVNNDIAGNGINMVMGPDTNPTSSIDFISFRDGNGSYLGAIRGNGSGGVQYYNASDARLKTNISDYVGALDTVMRTHPVKYSFKSSPDKLNVGFLAQELDQVYPYAVSGEPDGDLENKPMAIDYGAITPLLAKAIQELKTEKDQQIAELRAVVCELKPESKFCP